MGLGRLASTHPARCSFRSGVAEALDAADGSFDIVATCLVIHHLPAELRGPAVAEMHRVLRPGGQVLIGALTDPAMQHNGVRQLPDLVRQAGFEQLDIGDLHPWISYVRGVKPGFPGADG